MAMLTDVALEKMLWDFADGKSIQFRLPCGDLVWWEGQSRDRYGRLVPVTAAIAGQSAEWTIDRNLACQTGGSPCALVKTIEFLYPGH